MERRGFNAKFVLIFIELVLTFYFGDSIIAISKEEMKMEYTTIEKLVQASGVSPGELILIHF